MPLKNFGPDYWEQFRTEEEKYWDQIYQAHLDGDCGAYDCPLCREEAEFNHASDVGPAGIEHRFVGSGLSPRGKMRRAREER